MAAFHIKAQALRRRQLVPQAALGVFDPRYDPALGAKAGDEQPRKAGWRQSDVKRMIAAAEHAGLASYRVELAPDGTLSIIVGAPADTAADDPDRAAT